MLVAGGAGFIGSHLCDALLAQGAHVCCLDNFDTGAEANVARLLDHPRFTLVDCDVQQAAAPRADLILHLASPASPIHYRRLSLETMLANSAGTLRLLELARASGARFVYFSTSEVYGEPLEHPQRESYRGNVNTLGPRACYDEGKRFGEALTWEFRRKYGVQATILRLFNTYGPRMAIEDGRAIPAFVAAALRGQPIPLFGDGRQTRSFCYVDDVVRAVIHVAGDDDADGLVLNIGNPHETSLAELAEVVQRLARSSAGVQRLPLPEDDPSRRCPDIWRMMARYGWRPLVPLEDGLARTIEDFAARLGLQELEAVK